MIGSGKSSSGPSESSGSSGTYVPGSSSGPSDSSGSMSSSCICEFLIELTLETPFDLVVSVTNIGTCPLDVLDVFVGDDHTITPLPHTLAPDAFFDFIVSTDYDLRGLTGTVTTTCYSATFEVPVS